MNIASFHLLRKLAQEAVPAWVENTGVRGRKCHNINVIAFPPTLPSVLSLGADQVLAMNLYGPTGQQAPLTHCTLYKRSTRFMWKQGRRLRMVKDRMCGKRRNGRRWKLQEKAWKMSAVPEGQEIRKKKTKNKVEVQGQRERKHFNGFTSTHTFCSVGNVIQCDVCPYVPTHLRLEGHSERGWVGQDDISVCPLLAVVPSGRPHQQTGTTGSNGINLLSQREGKRKVIHSETYFVKLPLLAAFFQILHLCCGTDEDIFVTCLCFVYLQMFF